MRYFLEIVLTVIVMATSLGAQRLGDLCVMTGTIEPGVCRYIGKCPVVMEATFRGSPFQACASPENQLIVCCPWVSGQLSPLPARCKKNNTTIPAEGDKCTMLDTGKAGVCSQFGNCPTAMEAASKGKFPQVCAFDDNVLLLTVCCPLVTVPEGDQCTIAETGRTGKCLPLPKCPVAVETALKGITPQFCALDGAVPSVCCEGNVEGSHCTLKNTGMAGVCKPFANCQAAKEAAYKGIFQQKCDLTDNESELVCCGKTDCPPLPKGLVTQLPIGSKAADYCIELAEKIHPCQETGSGWTREDKCPLLTPDYNIEYHHTPITTAAEAPYLGRIGSGQRGDITWEGYPVNLVSDQWVLCSAYAINWIGSNNVKFVGLGGTYTPHYNPDEIYGVTKQHIHPLYNQVYSYVYNNIALLRLDREVKFRSRIMPVCLHTGTPLPNSGFILIGYEDSTQFKTSMQRVTQEECSKVFSTGSFGHPNGTKHNVEICSRPVNPVTTGGCLHSFSGSPLTLPNSHRVACTHLLVGFVSTIITSSCTVTNTRISAYIPWIEGIVWPESGVVV